MNPFRAIAFVATALAAPLLASPAFAQTSSPSLTEKLNAYVGCINRLSERSCESRHALLQLGRQERPDRQGADHLRHRHRLRHIGFRMDGA